MAITQTSREFPAQLTFPLYVEGLIDGLVAKLHSRLLPELYLELTGDLLGRDELLEITRDSLRQWCIAELLGLRPLGTLTSAAVCGPYSVAVPAPPLPTSRVISAGSTAKLTGNGTQ